MKKLLIAIACLISLVGCVENNTGVPDREVNLITIEGVRCVTVRSRYHGDLHGVSCDWASDVPHL